MYCIGCSLSILIPCERWNEIKILSIVYCLEHSNTCSLLNDWRWAIRQELAVLALFAKASIDI